MKKKFKSQKYGTTMIKKIKNDEKKFNWKNGFMIPFPHVFEKPLIVSVFVGDVYELN